MVLPSKENNNKRSRIHEDKGDIFGDDTDEEQAPSTLSKNDHHASTAEKQARQERTSTDVQLQQQRYNIALLLVSQLCSLSFHSQ